MAGITNRGKKRILGASFRNDGPAAYYMALCTAATTPTADTNTLGGLTEITAGNGYAAGGISIARNSTGFDVLTEDDTADEAYIQIKDIDFTASGGDLPNGTGATWVVITDDNATVSSRDVISFAALTNAKQVSDTQTLTIQNYQMELTE